jgi:hypothetical protein
VGGEETEGVEYLPSMQKRRRKKWMYQREFSDA